MALTIAGSSLTSRLTARLSTRRTTTAQADGDDAAVAWESLQVVSGLRAELVKRDVCREQLIDGVRHTVGLPESEDQELRATNVADHGHDLDRLAIGVLLVPFAEEQSAREPAGCAMIQLEQRDGWAGGAGIVVRSGWAACPTHVVPAVVAFALCNLGVRST